MHHICPACGRHSAGKTISPDGTRMTCKHCGHAAPLFIVTSASCAGKSALRGALHALTDRVIPMESDILWNDVYNTPQDVAFLQYRTLSTV